MPTRKRPRMLVVEDELMAAQLIGLYFLKWKIDHVVASTVSEAKALLILEFDLVILDIMLPDGSGAEVFRSIRDQNINTIVVIWTGLSAQQIPDVLAMKPDYLLGKPAFLDDVKMIAEFVNATFKSKIQE